MNHHIICPISLKCIKCGKTDVELTLLLYRNYTMATVIKVRELLKIKEEYKFGQIFNEFPETSNCISDDEFIIKQIIE